MGSQFFHTLRGVTGAAMLLVSMGFNAQADPRHGIAMYGDPALPPDFVSLPYARADAPRGGRLVMGNTGGFDSLNPFILKGTPPWQLRFLGYDSLMERSLDEPFTLYGLLAESVDVPPDRKWVEFTLRPEARFSDGSPVTVEDVIWSYTILGSKGHPRYLGFAAQLASIEQTGPRSLRMTFKGDDRELAMIAGLRPILKKEQWAGKDFAASTLHDIPIGAGAYVVSDYEQGRHVTMTRNPDYWANDLPLRRGTHNLDQIKIEFFADSSVMFQAFKAGILDVWREDNAEEWERDFNFPSITSGAVLKSEIPFQRPTGMTGLVMNSRLHLFDTWQEREAMLLAFNFPYINGTMTGGRQPRITSYFGGSELAMRDGPALGAVRDLLVPFDDLPNGAIDGYSLPAGDASARNRGDLRRAMALLQQVGWRVVDGKLVDARSRPFTFDLLLRQGDTQNMAVAEIYGRALQRLGIDMTLRTVDNAQYAAREAAQDFAMMPFRRDLSLSPGNEQRLYWGSDVADQPGSRNLMGVKSAAVDAMIDTMLNTTDAQQQIASVRALDRLLTAGRYVIPFWTSRVDRIAHRSTLKYPENTPIYGDRPGWMPDVWYEQENQ